MIRFSSFFIFIFLISFYGIGQNIESITFEGITKTKPAYLTALIECEKDMPLDTTIIEKDVQTLKNLNLFFSVDRKYVLNANGNYDLIFIIEEAIYLYPILSVSGFKNQLKVQAGGNQINFLGKAQSLGFLYQFYDRHSVSVFYTAPRHSNNLTGHELAFSKLATVEPLYFADTVSNFNYDNYSVSVGGFFWVKRKIRLGLGGMYLREKYEQLDNADIGLGNKRFSFNKYQIRFKADYQGINQHYEFREGTALSFYSEMIQTEGYPQNNFYKVTTDIKYFKRIGKKGNFGIRNKMGISTNNFSPFAPFVLDGFLNVRGIGNRVARGTAEIIVNMEYRHTLLKHKYFIAQIAVITDYGALRDPGQSLSTLFDGAEDQNILIGGGVRFHSRFIYKTIFRLDYSINPMNMKERGFTFGLGQFF